MVSSDYSGPAVIFWKLKAQAIIIINWGEHHTSELVNIIMYV